MSLFFEDFRPGDVRDTGSVTVTKEEIVAFAREFDPQPFHIDEEAARRSPFGGLIASGWQTCGICMRLLVEGFGSEGMASMGSPGVDELRWLRPVRPGDTLSLRTEVIEKTPSSSKPDRGSVRTRQELRNQRGELVLTMLGIGIFARRPGA